MDSTNMEGTVRSRSPSPSPSSVPAAAPTPPHTEREFWTNACISVLLDEYEKVFARSGRGHVKSKDWELIASQVNRHKDSNHRTPEQCKTKIEGLKKYYRKERLKSIACPSDSSRWLFFDKLSRVVGDALPSTAHSHPHPHPNAPQVSTPSPPNYTTSKSMDGGRLAVVNKAALDNNGGGANKKAPVKPQNVSTSDIDVLDRIDFRKRIFERMGLDRAEYQARMIDGFEDILVDSKVSDRQRYAKESSIRLKEETPRQIEPKNSPAEAEMGGNPRKARPGGKPVAVRKKRDYSSSLGKDIKDALSSFASVIEKIEKTKMHMATTLQKQRLEQDQHHAEMEVERTRMIMKNQLQLAKLICADRKRDGNQEEEEEDDDELEMVKKSRWDSGVEGLVKEGSEETGARHVENTGKMGLRMDNEEFRSHNEGGVEKLDEYQEDQVNLQGSLFGSKDGEMTIGNRAYGGNGTLDGGSSYRISGELDGSESFREDVASHTRHMSRANGHEVTDWANGMGMLWRGACHDLNRTINTHAMMEVGQGENRMDIVEDDERIAH